MRVYTLWGSYITMWHTDKYKATRICWADALKCHLPNEIYRLQMWILHPQKHNLIQLPFLFTVMLKETSCTITCTSLNQRHDFNCRVQENIEYRSKWYRVHTCTNSGSNTEGGRSTIMRSSTDMASIIAEGRDGSSRPTERMERTEGRMCSTSTLSPKRSPVYTTRELVTFRSLGEKMTSFMSKHGHL